MDAETLELFDWRRIFLGDTPPIFLFEMVFRTIWMYLWALLVSRLMGKRSVGDMTSFDYLIVVAIGSATGDPMMALDIPLLHGMVVLSVIMMLERTLARLAWRWGKIERAVSSTPTPLVRDGRILHDRLSNERMTTGELLSLLRQAGVRDVGDVERAWLEPTGRLSVFQFPQDERTPSRTPSRTTWPPRKIEDDPM